jgi:hypothetical protein
MTFAKVASVACTSVVLPGIGWAWSLTSDVTGLRHRVEMLGQQFDRELRGDDNLRSDIGKLRESIESMKADVLQRLAKVETKLEAPK